MTKSKRILTVLMAGIMTAGMLAACAAEEAPSSTAGGTTSTAGTTSTGGEDDGAEMVHGNIYVEGLPIALEPVTYTIMNQKGDSDKSASQNDKPIMQIAEDGTNVTIEWTETSTAAFTEQVSLMLATGSNMTDGIMGWWPSASHLAENESRIWTMDDETLSKFAPNIYQGLTDYATNGIDDLKQRDGKIYGLPTAVWSEYANWAGATGFIRVDWLNELGIDMPTNIDELYDAMVAIKDADLDGNGKEDAPFIFAQANWAAKIQILAGSWGMAGRNLNNDSWWGRVEDGVYKLNITEQRFYDFLEEMNKWYNAGLINIDGFSMTGAEYTSLEQQDTHALVGTWTPTLEEWEAGTWTNLPVIPAVGYEGQELKNGEMNAGTANESGFMILSSCETPEGLLRWWDNLHKDASTKRISRDGEEGTSWVVKDDVAYVAVPELPDGVNSFTEYANTFGWRSNSAVLFGDETAKPDPDVLSTDGIRYEVGPYYEEYFPTELIPDGKTPADPDAAADFAFYSTEITGVVETFIANSVLNGIDEAKFEAFKAELDGIGIDKWVEYYQGRVDGTL